MKTDTRTVVRAILIISRNYDREDKVYMFLEYFIVLVESLRGRVRMYKGEQCRKRRRIARIRKKKLCMRRPGEEEDAARSMV